MQQAINILVVVASVLYDVVDDTDHYLRNEQKWNKLIFP
jgi:hypothetical protein